MGMQPTELDFLLGLLRDIYEEKIPFNKILGFRIVSLTAEAIRARFEMQQELLGNYVKGILHGGVISSVLDATGGLTASFGILQQLAGAPMEEIESRISRIGTIDLRVDYLRPGRGRHFISGGTIMRAGRRVTVTRMELHNDQDLLIAVGTGTYLVG